MPRENDKGASIIDHSCRHCKRPNNSRQARYAHEKICPENPENKKISRDSPVNSLEKNKEIYEKTQNVVVPPVVDDNLPENSQEIDEKPSKVDDNSIAILIWVILLGVVLAGVVMFRVRLIGLFHGRNKNPPLGPGAAPS